MQNNIGKKIYKIERICSAAKISNERKKLMKINAGASDINMLDASKLPAIFRVTAPVICKIASNKYVAREINDGINHKTPKFLAGFVMTLTKEKIKSTVNMPKITNDNAISNLFLFMNITSKQIIYQSRCKYKKNPHSCE